jgi:hypothetical protein
MLSGCAQNDPVPPKYNYAVVKEADHYYLHKITSLTISGYEYLIFTCPICGNTIHVAEINVTLYKKVTLDAAWADYVDVCAGTTDDWQELLSE